MFQLPEPLHPALVHLPLGLSALMPVLAFSAALAIRRGWVPPQTWALVVGVAGLLAVSAWAAAEIGEDEEERVEDVVAEQPLHEHEEAADWVVWLGGLGVLVAAAGLARGRPGASARWIAVAVFAMTFAAAVRTGYLGGALVYEHGAADAWRERAAAD